MKYLSLSLLEYILVGHFRLAIFENEYFSFLKCPFKPPLFGLHQNMIISMRQPCVARLAKPKQINNYNRSTYLSHEYLNKLNNLITLLFILSHCFLQVLLWLHQNLYQRENQVRKLYGYHEAFWFCLKEKRIWFGKKW